jgi:transposase
VLGEDSRAYLKGMSKTHAKPVSTALVCKHCGSDRYTRNGVVRDHQRYHCKTCGRNFTDTPPQGYPLEQKILAVMLYLSGLSMRRTAKLIGVSAPTIQDWVERVAAAYATKPQPSGPAVVIEVDEMWHYLKKSPTSSGSGKLMIALQADWLIGNAAVVIAPPANV